VINSSSVLDYTTFSFEGSSTSIHTDINNLINTNNINNQRQLKKMTTTSASTTIMSNSNNGKYILVTGGAGYIGTHTILCLLDAGYSIIVIDNLINSSSEGLDRIKLLTTISSDIISSRLTFHHVDLCNLNELEEIFLNYHNNNIHFDCCIHFARLKAV
jgi:FlaA1/EpsC-like NDP-sugar epimerase